VQLHREFEGNGLVVLSLDIDPGEWKTKDKVVKFLTDQKADFRHYILREDDKAAEAWLDKYDAAGPPQLIAFDRSGKRVVVPSLENERVDELVKKLLADK
jgi:hypothetical protein